MKRNHVLCRHVLSSEGQINCTKLSSSQRCWFFLSLFPILGSVRFPTLIRGILQGGETSMLQIVSQCLSCRQHFFDYPLALFNLLLGLMCFRRFVDFSTITNIHHTIQSSYSGRKKFAGEFAMIYSDLLSK